MTKNKLHTSRRVLRTGSSRQARSKSSKSASRVLPASFSWHKKQSKPILIAIVCILLVSLGVRWTQSQAAETATNRGAAYDKLGLYSGHGNDAGVTNFLSMEEWLGRKLHGTGRKGDNGSTSQLISSVWGNVAAPGRWQTLADRIDYHTTMPLAFRSADGSLANAKTAAGRAEIRKLLQETASGKWDSSYTKVAQYYKDAGFGDATISLGHEQSGAWYPWSVQGGNCDVYIAAFRHVRSVFRRVSTEFKFDYTGSRNEFQNYAECAYPGNEYVDVIGMDIYDRGLAGVDYDATAKKWVDPEKAWLKARSYLEFHKSFALSKGKPVSFPEWGLYIDDGSGSGVEGSIRASGGDNPRFIRGMAEWMNALPLNGAGSLAHHAYFNGGDGGIYKIDDPAFKLASVEFKKWFGGSATTAPPVTSLPDVVITDVTWSPSIPRSGDTVIFSATIKNQGTAATPSNVKHGVGFHVNGNTVTWSVDSIASLAPGASRKVTANGGPNSSSTWTAGLGNHQVTATWDGPARIAESDETNNTYSTFMIVSDQAVAKPGDVDGNGTVNGIDLSKVLSNYGATNATQSLGDVNDDGVINGLDLSRVLTNYGK